MSNALFDQIVRDQSHKLHDLLPPRNGSTYCTRSQRYFKLPICKANRFKNTFIMANSLIISSNLNILIIGILVLILLLYFIVGYILRFL